MLPRSARFCARRVRTTIPTTSASLHTQSSIRLAQAAAPSPRSILPLRSQLSSPFRLTPRHYSDTATTSPSTSEGQGGETWGDRHAPQKHAAPEGEKVDPVQKGDPVQRELDAKTREVIDLKDKYLRSVADFRNLQERTRREMQAAKDFAIQRFARDLIESVDNLDLALATVPEEKVADPNKKDSNSASDENKDLRELYNGLRMTESILMSTLGQHGLVRFDPSPLAEKFDPSVHEATFQAPMPDKPDGSCFHTTSKGYTLNGRVIRAAKVGVVKNS